MTVVITVNSESNQDKHCIITIDKKRNRLFRFKSHIDNTKVLIDKIQKLIVDHEDTYYDQEKYEELKTESLNLTKRSSHNEYLLDYGDSSFVYKIATVGDKDLLYAYLSQELMKRVKKLSGVIDCQPTHKHTLIDNQKDIVTNSTYYNIEDILKETKWKDVEIRENSLNHLSSISQGVFNENLIGKYDKNYYGPMNPGKNVDIYIFDGGIYYNLMPRFFDNNGRSVKFEFLMEYGKVRSALGLEFDEYVNSDVYHGTYTSLLSGGSVYGVANKANIHGVHLNMDSDNEYWFIDIIAGLNYVKENLRKDHKTVINFSFGDYYDPKEVSQGDIQEYQNIVNEMSEMGVIFVSAAGNECSPIKTDTYTLIPCAFDNMICVGAIENDDPENANTSNRYRKAAYSNYGKEVDIYAPGAVHLSEILTEEINFIYGTSYSSPLVAGVAATVMSEHPEIKFTTKSMLAYLYEMSEKNAIANLNEGEPNVFLNNGKHTVYSSNSIYYGCGVYAGNQKCPQNQFCCGVNHQCIQEESKCSSEIVSFFNETTTTEN
ncbi:subtilisin-like protein [Neocallimastix lanati (nom. inval.)]|nr:subtilisin-like protein [Neocallimastix sp. JGI-2020a]